MTKAGVRPNSPEQAGPRADRAEGVDLAVFSAGGTSTFLLEPGRTLVVGRAEDADIRIDDASISRRHALFHGGPPVEIEDLGSANGTSVSRGSHGSRGDARADTADQRRITASRTALSVGDSVFFGAALVVVRKANASVPGGLVARAPASPAAARSEAATSGAAFVRDPALARIYEEAARAARLMLPVLLVGETGVGKDVLARFVHEQSPRAKGPLVALNCAALTESLAESELFGHERGAFTGARGTRPGLFESAGGGTVFLDEVGELPLVTQAKLLRTLESSEVVRIGSNRPIRVDVRVVSATNRDLEREAAEGRFRQDLYFRLNGITLRVPPLRARKSEIAELARRFLETARRQLGLEATQEITPEALSALEAYAWPGNVRELRYVMERTLVTAGDQPIRPEHFPSQILATHEGGAREELATRERVVAALAECDGNQTRAAERLGISRRTLINRMIEFGLPRPRKG